MFDYAVHQPVLTKLFQRLDVLKRKFTLFPRSMPVYSNSILYMKSLKIFFSICHHIVLNNSKPSKTLQLNIKAATKHNEKKFGLFGKQFDIVQTPGTAGTPKGKPWFNMIRKAMGIYLNKISCFGD